MMVPDRNVDKDCQNLADVANDLMQQTGHVSLKFFSFTRVQSSDMRHISRAKAQIHYFKSFVMHSLVRSKVMNSNFKC